MRLAHRPSILPRWLLLVLSLWLGLAAVLHGRDAPAMQTVCAADGSMKQLPASDSEPSRPSGVVHDCPLCATDWGPLNPTASRLAQGQENAQRIPPSRTVWAPDQGASRPPSRAPPPALA